MRAWSSHCSVILSARSGDRDCLVVQTALEAVLAGRDGDDLAGVDRGRAWCAGVRRRASTAVEVERMVNGVGLVGLAGRQLNVGYELAGQRVTLRMDGTQMAVISHKTLVGHAVDLHGVDESWPAQPLTAPARPGHRRYLLSDNGTVFTGRFIKPRPALATRARQRCVLAGPPGGSEPGPGLRTSSPNGMGATLARNVPSGYLTRLRASVAVARGHLARCNSRVTHCRSPADSPISACFWRP